MLQTSLARAMLALKGYTSEVEEAYTRALKLCEGQGEIPQLFPVLRGLSSYYMYRAEFDKGAQIGERILELAESRDDDYLRVHGYLVLGANTGFLGGNRAGLEILDKGIALFEREQQSLQPFQLGNNPGIVCYTTSAFFLWWLGYPDRALERANRAFELATKLDHPFTMAYALFHTGVLHMWRRELQQAQDHALAIGEIAAEHDYQLWDALATILQGAVQTAMGQVEEGVTRLERGIESYRGHNSPPVFWPELTGIRAVAYGQAGKPADGLNLIRELVAQEGGGSILDQFPKLKLIKGELLLALSPENAAQAAELFRQTLAGAQAADAKLLALHAATRLCKLEMLEGKAQESGRALAEIYTSFTEGFETADLREAKIVLDEWQAGT
jgi:tetratricopeptide (TPR) repeat protein